MESLETNKVFAAVLLAGMAFVGAGLLANALVKPKLLHESVLKIEVPEAAGTASSAPEPPIAALLASADAGRGEAGVKAQGCVACHSFNQGGKPGVGPNLYGVVGAPHGHEGDFAYSAVLKGKPGPWTFDELNKWLTKPSAYAPGTKMSYAGLADPKKRADIIMYLRSLSPNPEPLPPVPASDAPSSVGPTPGANAPGSPAPKPAPGSSAAAPGADAPIATRVAAADPAAGKAATSKLGCIACHTYNEGGKAGIGPNMYGVVGAPIAGHQEGYQYSAALKAKGGKWTYEELDKWLTKPAAYAPGTKMSFVGVPDPKTRADLIAYLRSLSANPEPLPAQ